MKTVFNLLIVLAVLFVFSGAATAAAPTAQNTALTVSFDRASIPPGIVIWDGLSGGYEESEPQKWGRNTLVCQSRTDTAYGACLTSPVWVAASVRPTKIKLDFALAGTSTVATVVIEGRVNGCGNNGSAEAYGPCEHFFTFTIPALESKKLNRVGRWTATLKQNLKQWPYGPNASCGGDFSDPAIGCPNATKLHEWVAKITLDVTDRGNQQIYLPAFPTSAPVINLNLKTRPGVGSGKSVSGSTTLDMCLYDGNNSASNRISLLLQDEGSAAVGRPEGQFSLYRRGGDKAQLRDRLDYQVSVLNPTTGAMQNLANGKEVIWSDTNRRNIQRLVVLPGFGTPALCEPAPLVLTTPVFPLVDKAAGDYSGTLRIIYSPTTQTAS